MASDTEVKHDLGKGFTSLTPKNAYAVIQTNAPGGMVALNHETEHTLVKVIGTDVRWALEFRPASAHLFGGARSEKNTRKPRAK